MYQELNTSSCHQDFKQGRIFATGLEDTWRKYLNKVSGLLWSAASDDKIVNKIIK